MVAVTLYTRAGCHLCDAAREVVDAVAAGRARVELVDIDADPSLTDRYAVRVPVVAVDGIEVAQYEVSAAALAAALTHAERGGADRPRAAED